MVPFKGVYKGYVGVHKAYTGFRVFFEPSCPLAKDPRKKSLYRLWRLVVSIFFSIVPI